MNNGLPIHSPKARKCPIVFLKLIIAQSSLTQVISLFLEKIPEILLEHLHGHEYLRRANLPDNFFHKPVA